MRDYAIRTSDDWGYLMPSFVETDTAAALISEGLATLSAHYDGWPCLTADGQEEKRRLGPAPVVVVPPIGKVRR